MTSPAEWRAPSWAFGDFDSLGFGLELETAEGDTFGIVWELVGDDAGLSLRGEPLRPGRLPNDGGFAIWDVTATPRWRGCVGSPVSGVELIWRRFDLVLCCDAIVLRFGSALALHLTLGTGAPDGSYRPSSDDVAVLDDLAARRHRVGGHGPPSDRL